MRESSTKYTFILPPDLGTRNYAVRNKIKVIFKNTFWCTLDHFWCDQMKRDQVNGTYGRDMRWEKYIQSFGVEI